MNLAELQKNLEDTHGKRVDISKLFLPWGDQAETAQEQGWYPETTYGDKIVYRAGYNTPFNTVEIPGQQQPGHLAIVGGYSGKFDVEIRDATGNVKETVFKGIAPKEVQNYITSYQNTVAQRAASLKGTAQQYTVR